MSSLLSCCLRGTVKHEDAPPEEVSAIGTDEEARLIEDSDDERERKRD